MIRFVGRAARGLLSGALTMAIIVGGPWALLHFFGSPIPSSPPDGESIQRWFADPISATSLRTVFMVVLWLAWALFVYVLAVETYAAVRSIRAPRIRLAAPLHGVAAGLVGATATALSAGAGHAAPPAQLAGTASATMPDLAATASDHIPAAPADAAVDSGRAVAASPTYRVEPSDWMEGVADRFLGDANAYGRIAAENPELAAADPRFPDHIEPGWEINLPPDARDRGARLHATGHLTAPAPDPTPPTATDPAPGPGTDAQTPPPPPTTQEPAPAVTAQPSAPTPTVGSTYPHPSDGDEDIDPTDHGQDIEAEIANAPVGAMSGAGLLASLVLLALQAERRRQTQHRRPGQRLPNPRGGSTERELRIAEAPADVERLDLALRHLAAGLADHPARPDIVGTRVIGGDVQLLLGADCDNAPDPWLDEGTHWVLPGTTPLIDLPGHDRPLPSLTAVGSRSGRHLLLDLERHGVLSIAGDPERAVDLLRYMICELACNTWSEDAEITIAGFDAQESQLLRELNWHRVRIAPSVPDAVAQLRRRIVATRQALEALGLDDTVAGRIRAVATDAWTPHILLVAQPDPDTRDALATLQHELAAAGRCAVAAVVATADTPPIGPAVVTATDDGLLTVAAPPLRMTTGAARLPTSELDKLAEILRLARTTELTAGPDDTETEPVTDAIEEPVDRQAIVAGLYDPNTWSQPETVDHPANHDAPSAPTAGVAPPPTFADTLDEDIYHWKANDTTQPRITILGPTTVIAHGRTLEIREPFHTEIVVYLASHPRGADRFELENALWPGKEIGPASLKVAMARTRSWLGQTATGQPWLADAKEKRLYRLTPGYLFDWHLFRRLRARAKTRGAQGIGDLRTALELVQNRPFYSVDTQTTGRKPYTWLGESEINPPHVVAAVIDVAHELAQHYLDEGDTTGARWAVAQAWAADPDRGYDEPWVDRMRAERHDGNRAELEQLHEQLLHARGAEVPEELAPATYRAIQALLRV
ncbi:MAG: hypothetical protein QOE61_1285 [Micromonosporaceae bacterium]|nr:hypothetical protein [Micromonosporaceae bacterium]